MFDDSSVMESHVVRRDHPSPDIFRNGHGGLGKSPDRETSMYHYGEMFPSPSGGSKFESSDVPSKPSYLSRVGTDSNSGPE